MVAVGDWRGLRAELFAQRQAAHKPKGKRDWFFLRERWNLYTDEMRAVVLAVANIAENKPLEAYSHPEKRAIATAIVLINQFTQADRDLIRNEKQKWERVYKAD